MTHSTAVVAAASLHVTHAADQSIVPPVPALLEMGRGGGRPFASLPNAQPFGRRKPNLSRMVRPSSLIKKSRNALAEGISLADLRITPPCSSGA